MSSKTIYEQISPILRPNSVAVIGASRSPEKIGHQVLRNLIEAGFPKDKIYPVNPKADQILGLKCYSSVKDIPDEVDLAVIVVPAKIVPLVLRDCVEKGVKGVAVISSGFKEVGRVKEEQELVEIARKGGFRLLGPNIVGICDTVKKVNASFCQALPLAGEIAFITQSGALGIALVGWTTLRRIGLSDLVSIGNKADIDECDLMLFFADDPYTKVITLYLEGTSNGAKFIDTLRKVVRKKPVLILKAGRAERTTKAIQSHTGSLAGSDLAYDVALKQTGAIRVPTVVELFDWATALAKLPLPKGDNAIIITNGGGAGVMATDACEEYDVKLMDVPPDLAEKLRRFMPPFGSVLNPVDLTGMATEEDYKGALETVLRDDRVHSVIILYCHTAVTSPIKLAEAIISAVKESPVKKPVVVSMIGGEECDQASDILTSSGVPSYPTPEQAVASLGAVYKYARYLKKVRGGEVKLEVDRKKAEEIIRRAVAEGRSILTSSEAAEVASAYGIPVPRKPIAKSAEEAAKLAEEIGYPVVLEIESPDILHKTEVGGIKVGLKNAEEVKNAFNEIMNNIKRNAPEARVWGVIVRKLIKQGKETIIGMHRDPIFGPMIMFGSGGIYVEIYKDVAFRIAPLTLEDAKEMVEETKVYKILSGFRGGPVYDIDSVVDTILRVSKLATDFEEISDIDINPLFVYSKGHGCMGVDIKIMLKK